MDASTRSIVIAAVIAALVGFLIAVLWSGTAGLVAFVVILLVAVLTNL